MEINFITVIELLGTFAFAISGIRLAAGKQIDWFGAYIIGLATSVGGGTARDLLLDLPPFWMEDGKYFAVAAVALLACLFFQKPIIRWRNTLLLFDAIGLGLFTIVGISKSLDQGLAPWVCIVMGTITGSVGGVLRDVLLNEVPLLFRKDVYALACVAGGLVYFGCDYFGLPKDLVELLAAGTVIAVRLVAIRFHIHLPVLNAMQPDYEEKRKS